MPKQIAITDHHGNPTGEVTSPSDAADRGLWHQGVHAIIYTADNQVLIQQRSMDTMQFPGMIELSLGGFVDVGESPVEAIIREIREETGITVTEDELMPIGVSHHDYRWQHDSGQKHTRAIIHNFAVRLAETPSLQQTDTDVASSQFIPYRTALHLVMLGRLHDIGRLVPLRAYHLRLLRFIRQHQ